MANNLSIHSIVKHFDELSPKELYAILQMREEVFQLEQNCLYKDIDGKDIFCYHVLLFVDDKPAACTRIVPEGISYKGYISVGRVATSTAFRKLGLGKKIMEITITEISKIYPYYQIKISAQAYLQKFYENFGFVKISEPYMEDDIPHIAMVR